MERPLSTPPPDVEEALTWGGFASVQVGLTECVLSDIAEDAVSFSNRRNFRSSRAILASSGCEMIEEI
jgi:hypothetical protein